MTLEELVQSIFGALSGSFKKLEKYVQMCTSLERRQKRCLAGLNDIWKTQNIIRRKENWKQVLLPLPIVRDY